jgi:chromate transporter
MQHHIPATPRRNISKAELFFGFLKIGLLGFGGVAPWARHIIVEERRWLSDREFAEILCIFQRSRPGIPKLCRPHIPT